MPDGMTILTEHLGAVSARAADDITDALCLKMIQQGVSRLLKAAQGDADAINSYADRGLDPTKAAKASLPSYAMLRCGEHDRSRAIDRLVEAEWMKRGKDGAGKDVYSFSVGVPFGPPRTETSRNRHTAVR